MIKLPPTEEEVIGKTICSKIQTLPYHLREEAFTRIRNQLLQHYPKYVDNLDEHKKHFLYSKRF